MRIAFGFKMHTVKIKFGRQGLRNGVKIAHGDFVFVHNLHSGTVEFANLAVKPNMVGAVAAVFGFNNSRG